ncbi:MAG: hypothetical protein GYA55_13405 [SAR324 cluster bacterium]|uniref:Uncharacterized protein n=1 Tax=SAR324 cluster bacterium TaxID=2024889 RepID=A0A7X9IML4_9DELT|nr:hypothetical protein [SAR324 cluster bacterium]
MNNNLKYEDEECRRFNDWLDEEEPVQIAGIAFPRSRILYEMENDTYFDAYTEFQEQEFQDLKQTVFDVYPAIIAYNLRLSEKGEGADDPVRKILHLKDMWEAVVNVLYAVVMGEVRFRNVDLKTCQVITGYGTGGNPNLNNFNTDRILTDSIKQKILNIKSIILHCTSHHLGFKCEEIDVTLLDDLSSLNDVRNDVSHHGTSTREQAEQELSLVAPIIRSMLAKTRFLERCQILRFESYASSCRCESFIGHSLNREFDSYPFTDPQKSRVISYGQEQLLVKWDEECFSLSPFLHFDRDNSGHESYLCFYKGKKNGKYWFEPVKIRTEKTFDHIQYRFESEKDDLFRLLVP